MKKSIAFILAVILLVAVVGTALAACSHNNWHTANTSIKTKTIYIYNVVCKNCKQPHTHWYKRTTTVTTYVCFTCGDHRDSTKVQEGPEHCIFPGPIFD